MATQTFTLKHPFDFRGTTYTKFDMRRPKVRDLRKFIKELEKDSIAAMEKTLGDLAEVDEPVIEEIDIEDFVPMKTWFEGFLKPIADASTDF